MTEHSQETKIAVLEAKVEHMMGHVKELTMRVRANEKVVAIVSAIGIGAGGIVGTTAFAPKAEAYPEYLEPRTQIIPGSLPNSAASAQVIMERFRDWSREQKRTDPEFDINNALAEYFNNGGTDTTEQEELLQLQSDQSGQSIGWRYDRCHHRSWIRFIQERTGKNCGG